MGLRISAHQQVKRVETHLAVQDAVVRLVYSGLVRDAEQRITVASGDPMGENKSIVMIWAYWYRFQGCTEVLHSASFVPPLLLLRYSFAPLLLYAFTPLRLYSLLLCYSKFFPLFVRFIRVICVTPVLL